MQYRNLFLLDGSLLCIEWFACLVNGAEKNRLTEIDEDWSNEFIKEIHCRYLKCKLLQKTTEDLKNLH